MYSQPTLLVTTVLYTCVCTYVRIELLLGQVDNLSTPVQIAVVGKYTGLQDSYLSVIKALKHSSITAERDLVLAWVEASDLEADSEKTTPDKFATAWSVIHNVDGIVIPGGFGNRGVEGKIQCAEWARLNNKPLLGVCLGFQCMVIEYCRNKLDMIGANSTEFDEETQHPAVIFMPEVNKEGKCVYLHTSTHFIVAVVESTRNSRLFWYS
jgi:CTP synthase